MTDNILLLILCFICGAVIAWAVTFVAMKSHYRELRSADRHNFDKLLEEVKDGQAKALDAARSALELKSEQALKAREDALQKEAEETFKNITGVLDKEIKNMKEAFEAQKKANIEESSSIRTKFDETVKHLKAQTESIGGKADKLADALRHDNKMQGNWGERMLKNIFDQEGLVAGRDYDREEYLTDEMGNIIRNEDTGSRMRPDFILHFPDNTDIIIDCKMNLDAYVDWHNAKNDEERERASRRNLEAVRSQVRSLSGKRYSDYVMNGHSTLNYVIMYISNYGALQLARQREPDVVNEAFKQNVLITTEETLMPFLRMIHTAWVNVDQIRNQEKIVKAAQTMVERVADYCEANAMVGKKLQEAVDIHEKSSRKLEEGGQSIVRAAKEVVRLGISINPKKKLPETTDNQ